MFLALFKHTASAGSQSAKEAPHQQAFMGSCLTISHKCFPCLPSRQVRKFPCVTQVVVSSTPDLRVGPCSLVCVEGIWMIKLKVVGFFIECGCYSGQWVPGMGVGYEKKTVLHSFRKGNIEFVFRKLKLVCERCE